MRSEEGGGPSGERESGKASRERWQAGCLFRSTWSFTVCKTFACITLIYNVTVTNVGEVEKQAIARCWEHKWSINACNALGSNPTPSDFKILGIYAADTLTHMGRWA